MAKSIVKPKGSVKKHTKKILNTWKFVTHQKSGTFSNKKNIQNLQKQEKLDFFLSKMHKFINDYQQKRFPEMFFFLIRTIMF